MEEKKGFTLICNKCGNEMQIPTEKEIIQSGIYAAGYDGEIGLYCEKCQNNITEDKERP